MDVKTLLGLTSAVIGTGIIVAQDPSFELPALQPVLATRSTSEEVIDQDKKITVRFKNASVDEVLDWLSNQGVNFVTAGVPKDLKVNLNVSDVPLNEVIGVIAEALGGSFHLKGKTYVFQPGNPVFSHSSTFVSPAEVGDARAPGAPRFFKFNQGNYEIKDFRNRMLKEFGPSSGFSKDLQRSFDSTKWEKFAKDFEAQSKSKSNREIKIDTKVWEDHAKALEKQFGEGSAFQKEMRLKFGPNSSFAKEMKAFQLENGKIRELSAKEHEKLMKDLNIKFKDFKAPTVPKVPSFEGMPKLPETGVQSSSLLEISKSLTPAQREKNKKQGFLFWSDLTKEQQIKLGAGKWSGSWTISVNSNGESFTVKSDK